jgi:hypothetical protein
MPEAEKVFWLILMVNFVGVFLTLWALWVYSKSMDLLTEAVIKLQTITRRLRQRIDRNTDHLNRRG